MIISLGPGNNGYNMGMGNNSAGGGGNQLGGLYNLVSWLPSGAFLNTINTWYHVAMVRESGVTKFYLNGVQAPNTFNPSPNAFTTAFQIGGQDFDPTHYWNGKIDEVKIYNVGLTAAQVLAEYNNNAQSPIPVNALQLWLKGDDGITKDANNKVSAWADQSVNGRTAVQSNSSKQPVWVDHVINGHAVVRYDAVLEDILETNYRGPNSSAITIFVVAQGNNISSPVRFQNHSPSSSGFLIYGYTHFGAANGFCMTNDGGEFNGINCGFFANPQLHIGTARWSSNTTNGMQTFMDGSLVAQRNSNSSMLPDDTLSIGTGNGSFGATDENTAGDIAEIIIYDRALTDVERAQVENYLNIKYRVTNNLASSKPGSGNAINFNGTTQSVSIPNSAASNFGTGNFSVEFWFNSTGTTRDEILISKRDDGCGDGQLWGLYKTPAGTVYLEMHNPGNINQRISVPNVLDGKWHHLSFVRNSTQLLGYKDGIQVDNNTATPINVNNSAALTIGTGACAPFIAGGGLFEGKVDEFKIWNIALTQSEIRDQMCHKITVSDPLYNSLVAYYNFDESTGTTVFDGTINANNGALINNPSRVTSGAPIGNASAHDYVNALKTASITHVDGENFTATSTTGSPDGIQVYMVTEQPNTLSGTSGVGANDKYVGVFQVNGVSPQYSALYNYNGNPLVIAAEESLLRLNTRADNSGTNWSMLTDLPNETANTITVTGVNAEFILGKLGSPLPLQLLNFNGTRQNEAVQLRWQTTNELNVIMFDIERSNGSKSFVKIGSNPQVSVNTVNEYTFTDTAAFASGSVQYYRLKIVDKNGRFVYSNIIHFVNNAAIGLTAFPNPVKNIVTIVSGKKQEAVITNAAGQLIRSLALNSGSQTIDCSRLAAGVYFIKTDGQVMKLVKE
jgi:hypothetical protein